MTIQGAGSGTTSTIYNAQQGFSVYIDYHAASQAYMASMQQQQQQQHQRKIRTGGISKIRVAYGKYMMCLLLVLTILACLRHVSILCTLKMISINEDCATY
jgi:hypothetical protein